MGTKLEIEIPEELKKDLEKYFPSREWPELAGKAAKQELEKLVRLKKIVEKSKLTEEQANELAKEVDKALSKKFREHK